MLNENRDGIGMTSARTRERLIQRLQESGIREERVLTAIRNIPRHIFVDEGLAHRAYEDTALPIGSGQTISQPFIVARMTELLLWGPDDPDHLQPPPRRVLEIGSGCGYQTAVLCQVVDEVFSIERIESLERTARRNLQKLNLRNYRLRHGDGRMGWPEYAPYDGILLTAAAEEIPPALFGQLAPGGRIVAPIGGSESQYLVIASKNDQGQVVRTMEPVRFVPLLSGVIS